MSDLSTATLQSLQALFQDCCFLMADKKSMINLRMFLLIDDHLRAIFSATSYQLFRSINILICGDFFQLPFIEGKPLYARRLSNINKIKGHQLYQAFYKTIRLTEIMWQQGGNPVLIWFWQTLGELRENRLTWEGWEFLCMHVTNQLSSAELTSLDDVLRLNLLHELL
jgi:hypothetical protein